MDDIKERTVSGDTDLPLADRSHPWDGDAARKRVVDWATSGDETDWKKVHRAFFWYDPEKPDTITGHKLGFADIVNGKLTAIPRGIFACAAVMMGARGGVDIPEKDRDGVKAKIKKYYSRMDLTPPWEQEQKLRTPYERGLKESSVLNTRDAKFQPTSYDPATHEIDVCWSTGARVRRSGPFGVWDEELNMRIPVSRLERLNTVGVILKQDEDGGHGWDVSRVIGRVVPGSVRITNGEGWARVRLSREKEDEAIVNKIIQGIIPAVSVGYNVFREIKVEGGGDDGVPLFIADDWEPVEINAVAIGADSKASFRSMSGNENKTIQEDKMDEKQLKEQPEKTENERKAEIEKIRAEERKLERERVAEIQKIGKKLRIAENEVQKLIDEGISLDVARARMIDLVVAEEEKNETHSHTRVEVGEPEVKRRTDAMIEYLCHRAAPDKFPLKNDLAAQYRGMTLFDIGRECLEMAGEKTRGLNRSELAHKMLRMKTRAGFLSTSDFPYLLGAVQGKTLRKAYDDTKKTFPAWCAKRTVPNYKTQRELQLSTGPDLEVVGEGGEYTYGSLTEGQETWHVSKYGKMIKITDKVIVNDDLDAFTRIPMLLGGAAARKESDIVYALLTANGNMADGIPIFHASHSNLGDPAAMDVAHLAELVKLVMLQPPLGGSIPMNIIPKFVLAPAALMLTLKQILTSITPAQVGQVVPDYIQGLVPIIEARLDTASETAYYVVADPAEIDTFVYGYLEGEDGPVVETEVDFDTDCIKYKVKHVFGAGVVDYRGMAMNAGA